MPRLNPVSPLHRATSQGRGVALALIVALAGLTAGLASAAERHGVPPVQGVPDGGAPASDVPADAGDASAPTRGPALYGTFAQDGAAAASNGGAGAGANAPAGPGVDPRWAGDAPDLADPVPSGPSAAGAGAPGASAAGAPAAEPPARAARLALVEGTVSLRPGDGAEWLAAVRNRPLTAGDALWVGPDGRAEVQLGTAAVRLAAEAAVTVIRLDARVLRLSVRAGTLLVQVRELAEGDLVAVETADAEATFQRPGTYVVAASRAGTAITVRAGQARVAAGTRAREVGAGERDVVAPSPAAAHAVGPAPAATAFEAWCAARERAAASAPALRYISAATVGYEDLDAHGSWREVPEVGAVWVPGSVPAGWAPYQFGHWGYLAPWGWTWIDDAPWGFAPFHYGRWANLPFGWGWIPGPRTARPIYAHAPGAPGVPLAPHAPGVPPLPHGAALPYGGAGGVGWAPRPGYGPGPSWQNGWPGHPQGRPPGGPQGPAPGQGGGPGAGRGPSALPPPHPFPHAGGYRPGGGGPPHPMPHGGGFGPRH